MSFDPVTAGLDLIRTVAGGYFTNKAEKAKFIANAQQMAMSGKLSRFVEQIKAQTQIITTEAKGGWLQRNWRPMLMCLFGIIIANNYLIYPYLALFWDAAPKMEIPPDMWGLLKLGVGGYVVGRTVEKAVKEYKK